MSNLVFPYNFTAGTTIFSAQVNANNTAISAIVNGGLDHTNLSSSAGITAGQINLTALFYNQQAASSYAWAAGLTGAANPGIAMNSSGFLAFGAGGSSAVDTFLSRFGALTLQISDNAANNGTLQLATLSSRTYGDANDKVTVATTGITFGAGGSTAQDAGLFRSGVGTLAVRNASNAADAAITASTVTASGAVTSSGVINSTLTSLYNGGRLYGTSGQPLADTTAFSALLFGPYSLGGGAPDMLAFTNSGATVWTALQFVESTVVTLTGLTIGNCYDIFAFNNSGVIGFDAPLAWTNSTTRATGLTLKNGVYLKTGDFTRRWLGTIYMDSATTTTDTAASRHIYNATNRVARRLFCQDTTTSWTYASGTIRAANANTTDGTGRFSFVYGSPVNAEPVSARLWQVCANGTASDASLAGVGINSTTTVAASAFVTSAVVAAVCVATIPYSAVPSLGYSFWQRAEATAGAGTSSFYYSSTTMSGGNGMEGTIYN